MPMYSPYCFLCPPVTRTKVTRKKVISQEPFDLGSKVKRVKVKGHKRSRSKIKVTINVREKAGGLRPMSSCFINSNQGMFVVSLLQWSITFNGCPLSQLMDHWRTTLRSG